VVGAGTSCRVERRRRSLHSLFRVERRTGAQESQALSGEPASLVMVALEQMEIREMR
jgi:hypothetical protein